jgi:hypothetical protein
MSEDEDDRRAREILGPDLYELFFRNAPGPHPLFGELQMSRETRELRKRVDELEALVERLRTPRAA